MKKIFWFVFLILMIISSCVALYTELTEKHSYKVQLIIDYSKNDENGKAAQVFNDLNQKELNEFEKYLSKNPKDVPPIYFILMADYVFTKNKDKAVLWYYIGRVRSTEDVMMCVDSSAAEQINLYPFMAPKTLGYLAKIEPKEKLEKYLGKIYAKALAWDISHPERVSPRWACYHGLQAFDKAPELKSDSEFENIQKEIRDSVKKNIK